jgi:hypothetical protein
MIVDIANPSHPVELDLPEWSSAEILDTPLTDDSRLRALVCRLGGGRWQWSISAIDGDRGELISIGIEKNAAAARSTAASEIAKCLENPLLDA